VTAKPYLWFIFQLLPGIALAQEAAPPTFVSAEVLNVRDAPEGNLIEKLARSSPVTVYEVRGDWARISDAQAQERWVSKKHLCHGDNCWQASAAQSSEGPLAAEGKAAVEALLLDSESARWKIESASQGLVCGKVNAKNRFGAYIGWSRFGYMRRSEKHPGGVYVEGASDQNELVPTAIALECIAREMER
jgi:SH3-like domain-containing protein